jgi:hypothetical protein
MGLGDGTGQKKPCHHLGPFFSNFLPQKILGYLKEFLRKKSKSAKKVTKLPALTVVPKPVARWRDGSGARCTVLYH